MTQVNESAAWHVECVVPAVGILVLPCLLDPLEDLEEGLKFDFTVRQVDALQTAFVTLSSTFKLHKTT